MRKLQIGVMGSAADLNYDESTRKIAEEVGKLVAQSGAVLVFGAEKDCDSLSTGACRGAKAAGGVTVGVTYGKGKEVWEKEFADIIIASGLERGGGRETTLVLSCDAIIAIAGGSGTLTEMAIAYQAGIPVVAMVGLGGWSEKLADTYIDGRNRQIAHSAKTAREAVTIALREATAQLELT